MEARAAFSVSSLCDNINSGAHGVMFQIRAKAELQVDALWVASGWGGKYAVELYCTEPSSCETDWPAPPAPPPSKPLAELTPFDIDGLLDTIQLEMYKSKFRAQGVTGSELVQCALGSKTEQHNSLASLGMPFVGHRETLLTHIRNFEDGVPLTLFSTPGALAECREGNVQKGQWAHCGYTTLTEPKRLVRVLIANKKRLQPGQTQAFYIHSKNGYGSAVGFVQGRKLPYMSSENSHVQVLGAHVTRDEVPFNSLAPYHCAFSGRVDYSLPEKVPGAV